MNGEYQVLVIAFDSTDYKGIQTALQQDGISTHTAGTSIDAINLLVRHKYQFIILDTVMPNNEWLRMLSTIQYISCAPVMVLSAKNDMQSKESAINMGAVDFMDKPINLDECRLRTRIHLCNMQKKEPPQNMKHQRVLCQELVIDPARWKVFCNGKNVRLPKQEFELLHYLALNIGQVLTYEQIIQHLWGYNTSGDELNALRISISRLRNKITTHEISTVRSVGYRLEHNPAAQTVLQGHTSKDA